MKISEYKSNPDWNAVISVPLTNDILNAMCTQEEDKELADRDGRPYYVINIKDVEGGLAVVIASKARPGDKAFGLRPPQHVITIPIYLGGDIAVAIAQSALAHGKDLGINEERQRSASKLDSPDKDTAGAHRANDHHTSIIAAHGHPGKRSSQRVEIGWEFYNHIDGLTDEEAASFAGIDVRSCPWKRCGELREPGRMYLEYSGIDRMTMSGRPAKVWQMTPAGREAWWRYMTVQEGS